MHLKELDQRLEELVASGRFREPDDGRKRALMQQEFGPEFLDAASNDYLGLLERWRHSEDAALGSTQAGSGSSRLIFGTHLSHRRLEIEAADWLGYEESLLFSSGFAANCGALSSLIDASDAVFSDRLNHASLIDGIRLSGAKAQVFEHLKLEELERGLADAQSRSARWVVVESYYSMDGDGPDLRQLERICKQHDAHLYVDEAHSIGVFGPEGAGLCAQLDVRPDLLMTGLGKAVAASGALVACSKKLRAYLWNRARTFVFSTAPAPISIVAALEQIREVRQADALRHALRLNAQSLRELFSRRFNEQFSGRTLPLSPGFGPIFSLVLGGEEEAMRFAESCQKQGLLVQAIRPPTVPEGSCRVRLTLKASWNDDDLERVVSVLIAAFAE